MKLKRKRILALSILIIAAFFAVGAFVNLYPMLSMNPIETGNILDTEILAVKNQINNMFLLKSSEGYILIDGGTDAGGAVDELKEHSIEPGDVKYILLTHTDYDHVGSLSEFPNAQIFLSEDEQQMIDGSTKRNAFSKNSLPEEVNQDNLTLLTDGQELNIGDYSITCIKSPGHTLGSMAYLLDGTYLFTGDAFRVEENNIEIHPYTMDEDMAKQSIKSLQSLFSGDKLVLTAHYGYYPAADLTGEQ